MQKSFYVALFLLVGIQLSALEPGGSKGPRIFQIGFHRCGTTSLKTFFQTNNIESIQWANGNLAKSIHKNHLIGLPLISPQYEKIVAFFDMEYHPKNLYTAQQLFKELDLQYPGSKFILNTRDKKKWLKSRVSHRSGTYIKECAQVNGLSLSEMFLQWSLDWDQHHAAVLEYFKDRPDDLIVFHIEQDPISKLCDFFEPYYHLNPNRYRHMHISKPLSIELEQLFEELWSERG